MDFFHPKATYFKKVTSDSVFYNLSANSWSLESFA